MKRNVIQSQTSFDEIRLCALSYENAVLAPICSIWAFDWMNDFEVFSVETMGGRVKLVALGRGINGEQGKECSVLICARSWYVESFGERMVSIGVG